MTTSKRMTLRLKADAPVSFTKRIEYRVLKHEPDAEWTVLRNGAATGMTRRKKQSAIDMAIKDARTELESSKAKITVTVHEIGKVTVAWASA